MKRRQSSPASSNATAELIPCDPQVWCAVYDQNWQHARHIENQRGAFAGVFVAGMAATYAILEKIPQNRVFLRLTVFVLAALFSATHSWIAVKLGWEFQRYVLTLNQMKERESVSHIARSDIRLSSRYRSAYEKAQDAESDLGLATFNYLRALTKNWSRPGVSRVLPWLYVIVAAAWLIATAVVMVASVV